MNDRSSKTPSNRLTKNKNLSKTFDQLEKDDNQNKNKNSVIYENLDENKKMLESIEEKSLIELNSTSDESHHKHRCDCSNLKSMVLLIALSTHSIFEGIALGLTGDFAGLINIMVGLIFHKGPAAMSLGISLSKRFKEDDEKRKAMLFVFLFALATPIGIGIGMLL